MLIDLPSQNPSRLIPTAQMAAPMTLAVANFRNGIRPVPARMGTTVRTNGNETSEHDGARPALVEELLRLLEILGLEQPGMGLEQARAVAVTERVADLGAGDGGDERADHDLGQIEMRIARARLVAQKAPARNRMESPGSGTGSSPDSTKTTTMRPMVAKVSMRSRGLSQLTATMAGHARRRALAERWPL